MLCEPLLLKIIFLVSIMLTVTSQTDLHTIFKRAYLKNSPSGNSHYKPGSKPGNVFCQINHKSTNIASNAATEAKAAKDAQTCAGEEAGQHAKELLAEKAAEAAKSAEAVLTGKKQILDQLQGSLCETNKVIEEVKKATSNSKCAMDTATRVALAIKHHKEKLQCLFDEAKANLESIRGLATRAQQEAIDKRALRDAAKRRVNELQGCLNEAQKDLERTRDSASKAKCAAEEAQQRIETKRRIANKLKILKKRDLQTLLWVLHARTNVK